MIKGVDVQGMREVGLDVFMSTAECRNSQPNETDAQDKVWKKSMEFLDPLLSPVPVPPPVYLPRNSPNGVKLATLADI